MDSNTGLLSRAVATMTKVQFMEHLEGRDKGWGRGVEDDHFLASQEYYTYVASNWNTSAGIYVDMANYIKMYDQMPENLLPSKLYFDKNTEYTFSLYLSMRTTKQSSKGC